MGAVGRAALAQERLIAQLGTENGSCCLGWGGAVDAWAGSILGASFGNQSYSSPSFVSGGLQPNHMAFAPISSQISAQFAGERTLLYSSAMYYTASALFAFNLCERGCGT